MALMQALGTWVGMATVREARVPSEVYKKTPEDMAVLKQSTSWIAQMKNRQ